MDWPEVRASWNTVRHDVRERWRKLTDDDLEEIDGRRDELIERLERRYAMDNRAAKREADAFVRSLL